MASNRSSDEKHAAKPKDPHASWRQDEEQVLPKNRLGIITFALVCTMFLGVLDQTIVATALPTIVAHLQGGNNYSWVGNAYMLSAGAFGPLYGKLSNMFGRKPILFSSIAVFLLGAALCGAAQDMNWLIWCRAFQGIGGGGLMQVSLITVADIVPLKDRHRFGSLLGATYGISSVAGPLLGGALAQHVSWRWCFFINLPIGAISATLLIMFLNVHPPPKRPLRDQIAELDFVGFFSLVVGVVSLLLGFSFSQDGWMKPRTIGPLVLGVTLLVIGGFNEAFTTRAAILAPRLFKTRTTGCLLATAFLHSMVFIPTIYYLPLFYQVLGSSSTNAGIKSLAFIFGSCNVSAISGFIASKMGRNRPAIWFGSTLFTIGIGLMITLDYTSSIVEQELFPMIAAIGVGFLYQIPLVALQAAMPTKDVATATSAFMFLRVLGGSVGLAVNEAIVASVLARKLAAIPNVASLGLGSDIAALNNNIGKIHLIQDDTLRRAILHAWARSIATTWMLATGLAGTALVLTLFLKEYSVERKTVCSDELKNAGECGKTCTEEVKV